MRTFLRDRFADIGWWFGELWDGIRDDWRALARLFKLALLCGVLEVLFFVGYNVVVSTIGVSLHTRYPHPTTDVTRWAANWANDFAQSPPQTISTALLLLLLLSAVGLYVAGCVQSIVRSLRAISAKRHTHQPTRRARKQTRRAALAKDAMHVADVQSGTDIWNQVVASARKGGSEEL